MEIACKQARIRNWQMEDIPSLAHHANNRKIWRNLADAFPYPYEQSHAEGFINMVHELEFPTSWAIEIDGEAVGSIGIEQKTDVFRKTAHFGYWLGESYWGQGIITNVIHHMVPYVFNTFDLIRLEAPVFEWNQSSMRVLEKNGFYCEARHRKAYIKDGEIGDLYYFVRLLEGDK